MFYYYLQSDLELFEEIDDEDEDLDDFDDDLDADPVKKDDVMTFFYFIFFCTWKL